MADSHLGDTRREWIEQSYAAAIDAIHSGDGNGAIRSLVAAVKTAASDAGDESLMTRLSSDLATVLPSR